MKARPILFNGPMVRALLDGRKTQTRRAVKPNPPDSFNLYIDSNDEPRWEGGDAEQIERGELSQGKEQHPYGKPGDLLWVRERWSGEHWLSDVPPSKRLTAPNPDHLVPFPSEVWYWADGSPDYGDWEKPRPSIHMPRWASRITLRITDVRVERLQEISEADAKAEGAFFTDYGRKCWHRGGPPQDAGNCPAPDRDHPIREGWSMVPTTSSEQCLGSPQMAFANLWQKISGPGSWNENPWVWAITFEVICANVDQVLESAT